MPTNRIIVHDKVKFVNNYSYEFWLENIRSSFFKSRSEHDFKLLAVFFFTSKQISR